MIITGVILLAVDCCGLAGIPIPERIWEMNRLAPKAATRKAISQFTAPSVMKPTWPRALMNRKPLRAARPGIVASTVASPGVRAVIVPSSATLTTPSPLVTFQLGWKASPFSTPESTEAKLPPSRVWRATVSVSPTPSFVPFSRVPITGTWLVLVTKIEWLGVLKGLVSTAAI